MQGRILRNEDIQEFLTITCSAFSAGCPSLAAIVAILFVLKCLQVRGHHGLAGRKNETEGDALNSRSSTSGKSGFGKPDTAVPKRMCLESDFCGFFRHFAVAAETTKASTSWFTLDFNGEVVGRYIVDMFRTRFVHYGHQS